jgi:AP-3 complex subunit delta-1
MPQLPPLRGLPHRMPPEAFVIDKYGEMPEGIPLPPSGPASRGQTPTPGNNGPTTFLRSSSFPPEDLARTSTPEPIKVTRAKKKGTGAGKKKRNAQLAGD